VYVSMEPVAIHVGGGSRTLGPIKFDLLENALLKKAILISHLGRV